MYMSESLVKIAGGKLALPTPLHKTGFLFVLSILMRKFYIENNYIEYK